MPTVGAWSGGSCVAAERGARATLKRTARTVRVRLGAHPGFLPMTLRTVRDPLDRVRIAPHTQLVIEGFPRSGNSFASSAFGFAQNWQVHRASNTHLPAQVVVAVRRQLPTLVVIRPPLDAVASLLVATPYLLPASGIREWLQFYTVVEPLAEGYVLATFAEVTTDFGVVIDRVNKRFGTTFRRFEHNDDNVAAVQRGLEDHNAHLHGALVETVVARPSEARAAANREARAALQAPELADLLAEAQSLYDRMVAARTA
jgi:hypothetical protein